MVWRCGLSMYSDPHVGGGIIKRTQKVPPQCERENWVAAPICAEATTECLLINWIHVSIPLLRSIYHWNGGLRCEAECRAPILLFFLLSTSILHRVETSERIQKDEMYSKDIIASISRPHKPVHEDCQGCLGAAEPQGNFIWRIPNLNSVLS